MAKWWRFMFSRIVFVALFMLIQVAALIFMLLFFQKSFALFYSISVGVALILVVYIINEDSNPSYKIAWIIPILALPVFGVPFYLMFGKNRLTQSQQRRMAGIQAQYNQAMAQTPSQMEKLDALSRDGARQAAYLQEAAGAPVFTHTETAYFCLGDEMFPQMLEELKKAEKFIFLEYFIIAPGKMWDSILEILEEKVRLGVDVRLLYDDLGCIFTLPDNYFRQMEKKGIRCGVFHRFHPVLTSSFNNRDHRKICVIDGNVAFTGGVNLADEYINAYERYGHWLDSGLMICGEAVWSFTVMFLSLWDYVYRSQDDFFRFTPDPKALAEVGEDGFVQPFTDTPIDNEPVGENAYLNLIGRAKRYVYISTPYLVIDNEMITALTNAAKSGVDVRIMTPGIPDKPMVYAVSRSYYKVLLHSGVRIFEYTPGFLHAKNFISDDQCGICGTINLDYRSLYLHYECAVWMYGSKAVYEMRDSFLATLSHCQEITLDWYRKRPWYKKLGQSLLRVLAPLM